VLALDAAYHTRSATRARWRALILLAAVEFMILLDTAIVNIALPAIKSGLHFGEADLPWIQNAYLLVFGGLLLFGGRAADLFGRRRLYLLGLALFTVSSLLAGLAPTSGILLAARALQGVGAAVVIPAEQSLLVTIFTDPEERNRALGVWGAAGAAGGIFGILLGGVITQVAGWPWIFLINVPVGAVVLLVSPLLLPESRAAGDWRRLDVWGALVATATVLLVAYAPVAEQQWGWGSPRTLGTLSAAAVLALLFVAIEARVAEPLVPLAVFRNRNENGANIVSFLVGAAHAPMFYLLSLYLQQALRYDALTAGLAILPIGVGSLLFSFLLLPRLLDHLGPRGVLAAGMFLLAVGLVLLARAPVPSNYALDILPASLIVALGLPAAFAGSNIAAVTAVAPEQSGLASGLMNTAQRVGSGIGIAILTAVFVAQLGPQSAPDAAALSAGFRAGFLGAAAFALLGFALALVLIRPAPRQAPPEAAEGQREPAHAGGNRFSFHH
jgi:EmrB/QacA subfamily drug resistance transporter